MSTITRKRIEITQQLSLLPDDKINAVWTYLQTVLKDTEVPVKSRRSLRGIWKSKGFERITDLPAELSAVRKEITDSILNREL
jgi:hypothetical protein